MRADRDPDQVLTVAQMRAAEEDLIAGGTSVDDLMLVAGRGVAEWALRLGAGRAVTVLCGPGNNGGDGYVAAAHLAQRGVPVHVIAAEPPRTPAAQAARARYSEAVIDGIPATLPHGEVWIDALFGSGLTRALPQSLIDAMTALAARHRKGLAVDVPSGIACDSGALLNPGLPRFDLTVALGAWKVAHHAMPSAALSGDVRLVPIGCAPVPGALRLLPAPVIAPPLADAHKYRRGLLAIVGGAMPGAGLLAAQAARHGGAGYVRLIAGADPGPVPPDLVVVRDPVGEALIDPRVAAVLVGPGLGRDAAAHERLVAALACPAPGVIDADALTLLGVGTLPGARHVLTPHEGELAALESAFGLAGQGPRHARALTLARACGAVVVAKGPDTAIAAPEGPTFMAPRASSWLSVAGTGDVLAGIIASRLAVTRDPVQAACEGVWLHGAAARIAGPAFAAGDLALAVRDALALALRP